jgi:hypothetical protein
MRIFLEKQPPAKLIWPAYHFCLYRQEIFPGCTKTLALAQQTQKGFRPPARTLSFFTRYAGQIR